jgi:hypothetical protein
MGGKMPSKRPPLINAIQLDATPDRLRELAEKEVYAMIEDQLKSGNLSDELEELLLRVDMPHSWSAVASSEPVDWRLLHACPAMAETLRTFLLDMCSKDIPLSSGEERMCFSTLQKEMKPQGDTLKEALTELYVDKHHPRLCLSSWNL